jgi:hypothetical protein
VEAEEDAFATVVEDEQDRDRALVGSDGVPEQFLRGNPDGECWRISAAVAVAEHDRCARVWSATTGEPWA